MRMLGARIDLQLLEHRAAQRGARQHALDSQLDGALWRTVLQLAERNGFQATRECRVKVIELVSHFLAGYGYLVSVDDNNVVASINVRSVFRLMLTAQTGGDCCGHTSQY